VHSKSAHREHEPANHQLHYRGAESWDDEVIRWVDEILEQKSEQSPLAIESLPSDDQAVVPYEWIIDESSDNGSPDIDRKIALRTTGNPLLDAESILLLREAAQNLWNRDQTPIGISNDTKSGSSSRFTLQFKENSECHLDDLVASDSSGKLQQIVDNLLTSKVYPLVRSAFGQNGANGHRYGLTDGGLCVYDSLVVRYNGDKAVDRFGASQPLHGDGGIISVNIALNSHRDEEKHGSTNKTSDTDTFTGGGTFFEDLIKLEEDQSKTSSPILRPSAPGHALAHWSTHRHAGAPTSSGTRDILVIFLTQRKIKSNSVSHRSLFNGIDRSFQLKLKARELPNIQRDMALWCLDLAIKETEFDAQAHFWKGFELIRGVATSTGTDEKIDEERRWHDIEQSVQHLERARKYAPYDAKISCYSGMAHRQRWMFAQKHQRMEVNLRDRKDLSTAAECLERALLLHERYRQHGISSDFEDNATTARLTLGEVYMQLERYDDANVFLSSIIENYSGHEAGNSVSEPMMQHINRLIDHCHKQQQQQQQHPNILTPEVA